MDIRRLNSKKQESKVAKELRGKITPASGALWGCKGDVRSDNFLVECKTTEKDFYSLNFNTWDKIYNEAIKDSLRIPVMCIDLNNGVNRLAVLCTRDLKYYAFNSPPCFKVKGKTSIRIKGENSFVLSNNRLEKAYSLVALPWEKFLEDISED